MNDKTLKTLEFDKILQRVSEFATGSKTRERILKLKPRTDIEEVNRLLDETDQALVLLLKYASPPSCGVENQDVLIKRTMTDGVLSIKELLSVCTLLRVSREYHSYGEEIENYPIINKYIENVYPYEALEKEINLHIVMRLKSLLEQNGVVVVLTREEDKDLASEQATNRKNEDLRARAALISETNPVLMVSIHQNSYPEADVDGAQVFYYAGSESGKQLGTMVQNSLKNEIDDGNHRVAKANKDYYLLKKAGCPAILVECGFLSNPAEAALLTTEEYQEKVAFSIHLGIMEYINTAADIN